MLQLIQEAKAGQSVIDRLVQDPLVASLLFLHGLHPTPIAVRIAEALERVRSRLRAVGGDAELISASADAIHIRLYGDAEAGARIRSLVEAVVTDAAPDASSIDFEEVWSPATSGRTPLTVIGSGS